MTMRRSKKQEYINGLEFDRNSHLQSLSDLIATKKFLGWWHGEQYTKNQFKKMADECDAELEKIKNDKTYKPWKDLDF